jgi:hypothetical protein
MRTDRPAAFKRALTVAESASARENGLADFASLLAFTRLPATMNGT